VDRSCQRWRSQPHKRDKELLEYRSRLYAQYKLACNMYFVEINELVAAPLLLSGSASIYISSLPMLSAFVNTASSMPSACGL
jgi:hypothetical protein